MKKECIQNIHHIKLKQLENYNQIKIEFICKYFTSKKYLVVWKKVLFSFCVFIVDCVKQMKIVVISRNGTNMKKKKQISSLARKKLINQFLMMIKAC